MDNTHAINVGMTEQRDFLQSIVDTVRNPMLVLDADLRVVSANRAFSAAFAVSQAETEGVLLWELGDGAWNIPILRRLLEDVLPRQSTFDDYEVEHEFPNVGRKIMLLNARKLFRPDNHVEMILLALEDVTARREAEARLKDTSDRLEEAFARLSRAYDREHLIAEALQRPLTLEVPENAFPGVAVATLYEAASSEAEVGGDFFDIFALPLGQMVLAVADASGKGLVAAARTMQVKEVLRAFAREYPHSPSHIVARLNDFVCDTRHYDDDEGEESFVCLAMVILEPATGDGTVISAGCEPPFILRAANGPVETISVSGLPLGIAPQELYLATAIHLEPGDILGLVTDGITEARQGREFLGFDGLIELARQPGTGTLRDRGRVIFEGAHSFAGGPLRDDACLLLVQRS